MTIKLIDKNSQDNKFICGILKKITQMTKR